MIESNYSGAARTRMLARYAALPLPPEREATVAAILDAWIPAADELSRKMSAAIHQQLLPITVLTHAGGGADAGEDAP
ncbi:MAG: hypothetical protein IH627_01495 [Rubrivivax sp.]|nr:hypothetical protein [Rubrivivax sp.]